MLEIQESHRSFFSIL